MRSKEKHYKQCIINAIKEGLVSEKQAKEQLQIFDRRSGYNHPRVYTICNPRVHTYITSSRHPITNDISTNLQLHKSVSKFARDTPVTPLNSGL